MEIFLFYDMRKKGGIKRELLTQGEVPGLMHSPEVWEHPRAQALKCPSLRRNALVQEPPLQQNLMMPMCDCLLLLMISM
jgi:hypothetical protein